MNHLTVALAERDWEELAHLDPLWAILVSKDKQFGKWDPQEFFFSGRQEIDALMTFLGVKRGDNGRVLDFGCGVGRLSHALQEYFGEVYGVDISREMLRLAKEFSPSCTFVLNQADNLKVFDDGFFDLIYSNIVLQHQPTKELAKAYIREFIRVVKPRARVVFQMPYRRTLRHILQPRRRLYSVLRALGIPGASLYRNLRLAPMRGISISCQEVAETITEAGGQIEGSMPDSFNYYSMTYVVVKNG
jgi:SAM-dependent methyltransferase